MVWATWCEPCRAELPYFAKLAERLKGREDALAVSFNIDENVAAATDFATAKGYTFPVLLTRQYTEDPMPLFSVPRTWITRNGTIAREYSGFRKDGDQGVEELPAGLK